MDSGYFNPRFLREMVDEHQSGARDYGVSLWSLLMFEAFLRKVMGARSTENFKVA
jgi:asparagine synthase (glutamine-hydrolysing)